MKIHIGPYLGFLLVTVSLIFGVECHSQTVSADNLSQVRVDDLSDEQILAYLRQSESMGLSEEELIQTAIQRGMPTVEIEKLRARISTLKVSSNAQPSLVRPVENRPERQLVDSVVVNPTTTDTAFTDTLAVFVASLFDGATELFDPNLRLATPKDYVLGPRD